jgi:hypothetical protein
MRASRASGGTASVFKVLTRQSRSLLHLCTRSPSKVLTATGLPIISASAVTQHGGAKCVHCAPSSSF